MKTGRSKTLLLVEDEAVIALNTKSLLEEHGYSVLLAADGKEAVKAAEEKQVDLILMDIDLGAESIDGITAAAVILEKKNLPILFLSSNTDPAVIKRAEKINSYGYLSKTTDPAVIDTSIKTSLKLFKHINECRQTESELENTRTMLHDVLNTIPVRVFWKDLDSKYMGCNRLFAMDSGKSQPEEIIGLSDYDIRDSDQAELNRMDDRQIIESGEPRMNYEEPFITRDGEKNWIDTSKIPLLNSKGEMYGILGMYEDITARKKMEEEVLHQKNRLANILNGSNVGTWEWNVQTGENIVNEDWVSILGYDLSELNHGSGNSWKELVHPDDLNDAEDLLEKHFNRELDYFKCEFRMRHKQGHWVWILSRGKVSSWTEDEKPLIVCGTHLDINERKLAQEEILHQLSEKEMILKEVHHRIKNNFSTICSFLSLQAASVTSLEAEEALEGASGRVYSMQALYEKLLVADDVSNTSLNHYLGDLVDDIVNVFSDRINIRIEKNISDCVLKQKQLFPLGIILNELITNVMKYAFADRDSGVIKVIFKETGGKASLIVQDNGIGLPEGFDLNNQKGFGLMLIKIFSQQLNGEFTLEDDNGTKSTLLFDI